MVNEQQTLAAHFKITYPKQKTRMDYLSIKEKSLLLLQP